MYLLIDIGNQRIKWNVFDTHASDFVASPRILPWRDGNLLQELDEAWGALPTIDRALVSSVAGEQVNGPVREWLRREASIEPRFIHTEKQAYGVTNSYQNHEKLGVDRWLTMLAGHRLGPAQAVCIVDCGTAITIDTVDATGRHLGGLILPGLDTMRAALLQKTEGVTVDRTQSSPTPFGRSTSECVNNGVFYAAVAGIDRAVTEIEAAIRVPVQKFITGGDAERLLLKLAHNYYLEPELVLKGLLLYID
jgi:type III pantothenate kinase